MPPDPLACCVPMEHAYTFAPSTFWKSQFALSPATFSVSSPALRLFYHTFFFSCLLLVVLVLGPSYMLDYFLANNFKPVSSHAVSSSSISSSSTMICLLYHDLQVFHTNQPRYQYANQAPPSPTHFFVPHPQPTSLQWINS